MFLQPENTPNESFLTNLTEQDIYQKYMIMKRVGFINMLLVLPDFLVEFEKEVKYAGKDRDSGWYETALQLGVTLLAGLVQVSLGDGQDLCMNLLNFTNFTRRTGTEDLMMTSRRFQWPKSVTVKMI